MNNEHVLPVFSTEYSLTFTWCSGHGLLSKHHWNSLQGCANSPSPSWSRKIFNICRVFHLSSDHPEIQKSFICEEGRKRSCYLGYPVLFLSPIFNNFHCSNNITAGLPSSRAVENISTPANKWRKIATHYTFCRISLLISLGLNGKSRSLKKVCTQPTHQPPQPQTSHLSNGGLMSRDVVHCRTM